MISEYEERILCSLLAKKYELPAEAIVIDLLDFFKVIAMGSKKYALNNWLLPTGKRNSEKEMHDSMFHHLAESYTKGQELVNVHKLDPTFNITAHRKTIADAESGLSPALHLATRALMIHVLRQYGVLHEKDK